MLVWVVWRGGNKRIMKMLVDEREANKNLVRNLNYIKILLNVRTDRELAERIGVSPATITGIRNDGNIPTLFPFFQGIMNMTGFTLEELLNKELSSHGMKVDVDYTPEEEEMSRYQGLYFVYYFRTSAFKGRETKDDANALEYGLLGIYSDANTKQVKCRAVMGLNRKEAEARYDRCMEARGNGVKPKKNFPSILADFTREGLIYEGEIKLTHGHIFITCSSGIKDILSMIIHRPDSRKQRYIGGLGAAVSVSKGRDSCPCVQFVGMSRYKITASSEEIAKHIELGYPSIKPGDELDQVLDQISVMLRDELEHTMTDNSHRETDLTERNRRYIISAHITTLISRIVERNLFRVVKVSATDDDDWYHFVKYYNEKGEKV